MKGLLVRVGVDSAAGSWNAPVDTRSGEFVYVTIPENEPTRPAHEHRYEEVGPALARFGKILPASLRARCMHLDPDFEYLTYGDVSPRSRPILELVVGDAIAFYAGLRSIWPADRKLTYALIGVFMVEETVLAASVPRDRWHENAHTKRREPNGVIVRAKPSVSGRLERCLPIGEYRERAYRVRRDLLEAWGGLDVRGGYIQRSGRLPSFCDTDAFLGWFRDQGVSLVQRNN